MAGGLDNSVAGLVFLGVAEVPQIMSAFLPSPTTAYMGGSDPNRVAWLRRGEIMGGTVSMALALGISLIAREQAGNKAFWIMGASGTVLALFLFEYERAIRLGQEEVPSSGAGSGY